MLLRKGGVVQPLLATRLLQPAHLPLASGLGQQQRTFSHSNHRHRPQSAAAAAVATTGSQQLYERERPPLEFLEAPQQQQQQQPRRHLAPRTWRAPVLFARGRWTGLSSATVPASASDSPLSHLRAQASFSSSAAPESSEEAVAAEEEEPVKKKRAPRRTKKALEAEAAAAAAAAEATGGEDAVPAEPEEPAKKKRAPRKTKKALEAEAAALAAAEAEAGTPVEEAEAEAAPAKKRAPRKTKKALEAEAAAAAAAEDAPVEREASVAAEAEEEAEPAKKKRAPRKTKKALEAEAAALAAAEAGGEDAAAPAEPEEEPAKKKKAPRKSKKALEAEAAAAAGEVLIEQEPAAKKPKRRAPPRKVAATTAATGEDSGVVDQDTADTSIMSREELRVRNRYVTEDMLDFDFSDAGIEAWVPRFNPENGHLLCDFCPKEFRSRKAAERHIVGHDPRRQFPCDNCNMYFANITHRVRHQRSVHLRFKAHCRLCGKSFACEDSVRRHEVAAHSRHFPYQCPVCPMTFPWRHKIEGHLASVHGIHSTEYPCPSCVHVSPTLELLREHWQLRHALFGRGAREMLPETDRTRLRALGFLGPDDTQHMPRSVSLSHRTPMWARENWGTLANPAEKRQKPAASEAREPRDFAGQGQSGRLTMARRASKIAARLRVWNSAGSGLPESGGQRVTRKLLDDLDEHLQAETDTYNNLEDVPEEDLYVPPMFVQEERGAAAAAPGRPLQPRATGLTGALAFGDPEVSDPRAEARMVYHRGGARGGDGDEHGSSPPPPSFTQSSGPSAAAAAEPVQAPKQPQPQQQQASASSSGGLGSDYPVFGGGSSSSLDYPVFGGGGGDAYPSFGGGGDAYPGFGGSAGDAFDPYGVDSRR